MWEKVRLTSVCDFQGGTQPSKSEWSSVKKEDYVRMLQIRDFTQKKDSHIEYVKDSKTLKKCNDTDILIARYGASIGKILTGLSGAYNVAIVKTIPDDKLLFRKYLYFYLNSYFFQNKLINVGDRAAQAGFNKEELKEFEIPLPPLPIQEKIADILDKADELRRKDKDLQAKYDELAQAIFIDMFGDPVRNEKGWEVKRLDELCLKITDGTHHSPTNVAIGKKYITAKHIKNGKLNFFLNETYVSEEDHKTIFSRCNPEFGDVLYIKDGATTGMAAVNDLTEEFSMLSSLALFKLRKDIITSNFLVYYLNSSIVKENLIRENMAGAAIKRFTLQKIKNFSIIVPPIALQETFAKKIELINQLKAQTNAEKSEELFQSLLQKAFKGELVS